MSSARPRLRAKAGCFHSTVKSRQCRRGMSARLAFPSSRFSARLLGLVALPSEAHGQFTCHPGTACPAVFLGADAQATVWSAVADLNVFAVLARIARTPVCSARAQASKRYSFSWGEPSTLVQAGNYTESGLALHAGLGLELDVIGVPIRVEASDYWSPEGKLLAAGRNGAPDARRAAQHDLSFTLGWTLLRSLTHRRQPKTATVTVTGQPEHRGVTVNPSPSTVRG